MAEQSTLARPYAKAAFEVALEANKLSDWSSMLQTAALIAADASVLKYINEPSLTIEKQSAAMLQLCEGYLDNEGQNFIKVLATNGRLSLISEIAVQFEIFKQEHDKTIEVVVESAIELSDDIKSQITAKLTTKLGREVRLNNQIKPELLGGMVIRAEDLVIDSSVRGKLNRLTDTLNV
jgi:F-type H+-transporting ATPase subunit delta